MTLSLDLGSFLVGVLATLAIVTAWLNRPAAEPQRQQRVACSRRFPVAEPPSNVALLDVRDACAITSGRHVMRPYDGDLDGWS